jgi:hypothetical protein
LSYRRYLREYYIEKRKADSHKHKSLEGKKFKSRIDEHMRTRKVPNMVNSVNQQNPKMNNGERK